MHPRPRPISVLVLLLLVATGLTAQADLEDNSVTVISNFEARLTDAERVRINPTLPATDTTSRRQTYTITPRAPMVDYPAPTIRPRAVKRGEQAPVHNGFVKLGGGAPNSIYGDASYDLRPDDRTEVGFYGRHYSFNNNGNVENQRAADTHLGAEGSYLFDQGFKVNGGLSFDTRSRYYYGYNFPEVAEDSSLTFEADEVRQRYNTFGARVGLVNGTRTQGDIDYHADIDFYVMTADPSVRETGLDINIGGTKWINGGNPLDVEFSADFTGFRDTANQSLNVFTLSPSYTVLVGDRIKLKAGVRLLAQEDDFDVFPNFTASASIVEGAFNVFAGIQGDVQKNTLRSLADYNPWINARVDRLRNSEVTRYYGGLEGSYHGIAYRVEGGYRYLDNLALFVLNRDARDRIPRYDVIYDDGGMVYLQGTATIPLIEGLDLNANVIQRFYSLEDEEKPFHLPALSLNAAGIYSFPSLPLQVRADLFVENGLPYQTLDGGTDNLNALLDLSLSGEYTFNDRFGAWLRVNNLLNNKRERFFRYPTIGTNLLVGASVVF